MNAHAPSWKTYAPSPVWKDSTRSEVQWFPLAATPPLARKRARKLYYDARRFEGQTRRPGRQDGKIGRNGMMVLQSLIFDFLNYGSGRLDPGYAAIAAKANLSIRSVARGLAKLKAAGVLTWLRRCSGKMVGDRYELVQETNAYAVASQAHWKGFVSPAPAPAPDGTAWGQTPPLPSPLGFRDALAVLEAARDRPPPRR